MMEKLSPGDVLFKVHEAAEELQRKIDRRSYLLVNSESWEIGKRSQIDEKDVLNNMEENSKHLAMKSRSETVLDLRSIEVSKSWDICNSYMGTNHCEALAGSPETNFQKQISLPSQHNLDSMPNVEETKTYESASALSLATFASLLIEFVARLQNVVDSFKELSEKANFKEVIDEPAAENVGFWTRLSRWYRSKIEN